MVLEPAFSIPYYFMSPRSTDIQKLPLTSLSMKSGMKRETHSEPQFPPGVDGEVIASKADSAPDRAGCYQMIP